MLTASFLVFLLCVKFSKSLGCYEIRKSEFVDFCSLKENRVFIGDFDGNGVDDVLCHDAITGDIEISFSLLPSFDKKSNREKLGWCKNSKLTKMFVGDFNGDRRDDLLCFHYGSGLKEIAYAQDKGEFSGSKRYSGFQGWCIHKSAVLIVGDFNGDGFSDLLCHDTWTGYKWIANGNNLGTFRTNWHGVNPKCDGEMLTGNFNGDRKTDMLCYSHTTGRIQISLSRNWFMNKFDWTNTNGPNVNLCKGENVFLTVADVDGDNYDDIICKDLSYKTYVIRFEWYFNSDFIDEIHFCSQRAENFLTGNFNGNRKKNFLCHSDVGTIQVAKSKCSTRNVTPMK